MHLIHSSIGLGLCCLTHKVYLCISGVFTENDTAVVYLTLLVATCLWWSTLTYMCVCYMCVTSIFNEAYLQLLCGFSGFHQLSLLAAMGTDTQLKLCFFALNETRRTLSNVDCLETGFTEWVTNLYHTLQSHMITVHFPSTRQSSMSIFFAHSQRTIPCCRTFKPPGNAPVTWPACTTTATTQSSEIDFEMWLVEQELVATKTHIQSRILIHLRVWEGVTSTAHIHRLNLIN